MSYFPYFFGGDWVLNYRPTISLCSFEFWHVEHCCVGGYWDIGAWWNRHQQAVTNPLSDCPGQLKILLGNQKFKVLCPNGQLISKQRTGYELKFCHYFWHFNRCVWFFISKQVEGDSFNLICSHYVPKRWCYKVLQAIFHNIKFWVQNPGTDRAVDLQCQVAPWGYLLRKICGSLDIRVSLSMRITELIVAVILVTSRYENQFLSYWVMVVSY